MKTKNRIKTPYRLDIVMGGVSDLSWWQDKEGDCLSLSCDFIDTSIDIDIEKTETNNIQIIGFGNKDESSILDLHISELNVNNISNIPSEYRLIVSSIIVGFDFLRKAVSYECTNGFIIRNMSSRVKGMGGSSVVAATTVMLMCNNLGGVQLGLQEIVDAVVNVEQIANICGGWEDVAGVYNAGVNWVQYRPNDVQKLSIVNIPIKEHICEALNKRLIVADTQIDASTGLILSQAEANYNKNPQLVEQESNKIRQECHIIQRALECGDISLIGHSFLRQRVSWNIITDGVSSNDEISLIMNDIAPYIAGFKEAGAGGGGTLLIMCNEGTESFVREYITQKGFIVKEWRVSKYGLSINV